MSESTIEIRRRVIDLTPKGPIRTGSQVFNLLFGPGFVQSVEGNKATVKFTMRGEDGKYIRPVALSHLLHCLEPRTIQREGRWPG